MAIKQTNEEENNPQESFHDAINNDQENLREQAKLVGLSKTSEALSRELETTSEQKKLIDDGIQQELYEKSWYDYMIENKLCDDEERHKRLNDLVNELPESVPVFPPISLIQGLCMYGEDFDLLKKDLSYILEYTGLLSPEWSKWFEDWNTHVEHCFLYKGTATLSELEHIGINDLRSNVQKLGCSDEMLTIVVQRAEGYGLDIPDYSTFQDISYSGDYYTLKKAYAIDHMLTRLLSLPWGLYERVKIEALKQAFPDPLLRDILVKSQQEMIRQGGTKTDSITTMVKFATLWVLFRDQVDLEYMMHFHMEQVTRLIREGKDAESIIDNLLYYLGPIERDYEDFDSLVETLLSMKRVFEDKKIQWRERFKFSASSVTSDEEVTIRGKILGAIGRVRTTQEQKEIDETNHNIAKIKLFFSAMQNSLQSNSSLIQSIIHGFSDILKNTKEFSKFPGEEATHFQWFYEKKKKYLEEILQPLGIVGDFEFREVSPQQKIERYYGLLSLGMKTQLFPKKFYFNKDYVDQLVGRFMIANFGYGDISTDMLQYIKRYGYANHIKNYYVDSNDMKGAEKKDERFNKIYSDTLLLLCENNDTTVFETIFEKVEGHKSRWNKQLRDNIGDSDFQHTLANICLEKGHKEFLYELIKHDYKRYKNEKLVVGLFSDEWIDFLEENFIVGDQSKTSVQYIGGKLFSKITLSEQKINRLEGRERAENMTSTRDYGKCTYIQSITAFLTAISKNNISANTASRIVNILRGSDFYHKYFLTKDTTSNAHYEYHYTTNSLGQTALGGNGNLFKSLLHRLSKDSSDKEIDLFEQAESIEKDGVQRSQLLKGKRRCRSIIHMIADAKQQSDVPEMVHSLEKFVSEVDVKKIFTNDDAHKLAGLSNQGYYGRENLVVPYDVKMKYLFEYEYKGLTGLQLLAAKGHISLVEGYLKGYKMDIWGDLKPTEVMNNILGVEGITPETYDWFLEKYLQKDNQNNPKLIIGRFGKEQVIIDMGLPNVDYLEWEKKFENDEPNVSRKYLYNLENRKQYTVRKKIQDNTIMVTYDKLRELGDSSLLPSEKDVDNIVGNNGYMIQDGKIIYRAKNGGNEEVKQFKYAFFLYFRNGHLMPAVIAENKEILKHILSKGKLNLSRALLNSVHSHFRYSNKQLLIINNKRIIQGELSMATTLDSQPYIDIFVEKYVEDGLIDRYGLEFLLDLYLGESYFGEKNDVNTAISIINALDPSCGLSDLFKDSIDGDNNETVVKVLGRIEKEIRPHLSQEKYEKLFGRTTEIGL